MGQPDSEGEAVFIISHTLEESGKELGICSIVAQEPIFSGHSDTSGLKGFQISSLGM